jgi:hypothetical protein
MIVLQRLVLRRFLPLRVDFDVVLFYLVVVDGFSVGAKRSVMIPMFTATDGRSMME